MCLASEAGKMDVAQSHPEDSSSKASLQQTPVKSEIKEEKMDTDACPPSPNTSAVLPSLPAVTSTSTDAIPPQLSSQNARVKNKSKKKEVTKSHDAEETPCPAKKIFKKCNHAETNKDSVCTTIDAVAKGAWKDAEEKPKKKLQSSPNGANSVVPKKNSKPKVKTSVKETEEEVKDGSEQSVPESTSEVEMKEEPPAASPETEAVGPAAERPDTQSSTVEPCSSPCSPSSAKLKEMDKRKEGSNDGTCESNAENCGSRKSERRCKGALYKTLVSEGMLTSLRANIDRGIHSNAQANILTKRQPCLRTHDVLNCLIARVSVGKRGAFRASDHDANWSDDSWTVSQVGPNNPKKLKKSKSKDESSQGSVMSPLITLPSLSNFSSILPFGSVLVWIPCC